MIDDISAAEWTTLEAYTDRHLVREGDNWITDYERVIPWAVIWWEKDSTTRKI